MEGIFLSKLETEYFNKIFDFCADEDIEIDDEPAKAVSASKVKIIFLQSGVNSQVLKQIWSKCANKKRHLDKSSFMKALKCISIVQAKNDLRDLTVDLKEVFDLPVFENEQINIFLKECQELVENETTQSTKDLEFSFRPKREKLNVEDQSKEESQVKDVKKSKEETKIQYSDNKAPKVSMRSVNSSNEERKNSESLEIDIIDHETVQESYFTSHTKYKVVTKAYNIEMVKEGSNFEVWRRFSDFEWFHNHLLEQDEYKGIVLPSLPEKSYFSRNNEAFIETRKRDLSNYLKTLARHKKVKNSKILQIFLTMSNEEEFENLKVQDSNLQQTLFEYANKIRNIDVDYLMVGIHQMFDNEEPEKFELKPVTRSRVQGLLDYEKQLSNIVSALKIRCELNDKISDSMSDIALGLEKFRLNSETADLDKLFLLGGFIEEEDIEDLDNIALSKINSRDSDRPGDEYGSSLMRQDSENLQQDNS